MSATAALTMAVMRALSPSLTCMVPPSRALMASFGPSTFSIVPRMRMVCGSCAPAIEVAKKKAKALNLTEGTRLTLEVRGHEIVLSKGDDWKKLRGALANVPDLMEKFAAFRREEREREDSGI